MYIFLNLRYDITFCSVSVFATHGVIVLTCDSELIWFPLPLCSQNLPNTLMIQRLALGFLLCLLVHFTLFFKLSPKGKFYLFIDYFNLFFLKILDLKDDFDP